MSSRLREMAAGLGLHGVADIQICGATSTNEAYQYWHKYANAHQDVFHTSLVTAEAALTANRNDVLMFTPENHTLAATLTWSNNMTHLIGMYPPTMMNMRSRIGHAVTLDPLINVTGYGCSLQNIYTMYGTDNATDLTCLKVTGNRNTFKHCHFLCQHDTPMDEATFKMLHFTETSPTDGLEHYFDHCTVSAQASTMTDGELIKINGTPRLIFEDCNFLMTTDAADPRFMDSTAGDGAGFVIFKNCVLHNFGTSLLYAFGSTSTAAGTDYLLVGDTTIGGVDDVIAAADEAKTFYPARVGVTEDAYAGLSIPIDQTG